MKDGEVEEEFGIVQENENYADWKKKTVVFLSSQSLSMFGSAIVQYAIVWHLTLTTQSGAVLTIATVLSFLPQIIISPFAGVWADRYPRKFLIIAADLLTALSTLGLAVAFLLGYRELWLLYLVSAIRSLGGGIQSPAVGALLPQIVPSDKLMRVNGINGSIQPFIFVAAPVLSGALLSLSKLEIIFFIDVVTAALAIALLANLAVKAHAKASAAQTASYLDDLKAGVAYIHNSRTIKLLFAYFAVSFFLMTPVIFLSPLLVARSFGEEVWKLTANEVTFFVGSILGGLLMTAWGGFKNPFRTIGLSGLLWAVMFGGMGLTHSFIVYLVLMFLAGIPMPMMNVPTTTLLQQIVEPDIQGRVFSVMMLINSTIMPLGMLVFGPIADVISIETLLVISSAALLIPSAMMFFYRQPLQPAAGLDSAPAD